MKRFASQADGSHESSSSAHNGSSLHQNLSIRRLPHSAAHSESRPIPLKDRFTYYVSLIGLYSELKVKQKFFLGSKGSHSPSSVFLAIKL